MTIARRFRRGWLWALAALCASALPAGAQLGPRVLTLPASTRAAAMGDAFGISLVDSDAVFYNAAFNDRLRGAGFSIALYDSNQTLYTVSAGTDWFGGAVGFGLQSLQAPGGSFPTAEQVISLVYGRRIKGLRLAFTGKYFEQRGANDAQRLVMGDLATSFTYRALSIGVAAQNLGWVEYWLDDRYTDVPLRGLLNVATARSLPIGALDVAAAATVAYTRGGEISPGGGVELSYYPVTGRTFFARAGVRNEEFTSGSFTFGGGFAGDRIVLDYALEPQGDGLRAHRFGLKWR